MPTERLATIAESLADSPLKETIGRIARRRK
jgi:hypothetical protein